MEAGSRKRKLEEAPEARAEGGTQARQPPAGVGEGAAAVAARISDIPDPILADIVSLLPTKDGARTQILASRWRHIWRAGSLNLDCIGLAGYHFPDDEHALALAALIPRVISTHPGPGRRFCVPAHYLRSRSAAVDAWLRSPTLDGLHELEFRHVNGYKPTGPLPPLPTSAFRFSPTLRVATIRKCHLPDSTALALHFPELKQLALVDVVVSETWLHSMIAGCPALECLLIHATSGVRCIRISSLTLRSVGVFVGRQQKDELRLQELIIENAPCLERLFCLNLLDGLHVSVTSAPKVQIIGCICDWSDFVGYLMISSDAVIQELHLDRLTAVVSTVKTLAVDLLMFDLVDLDTVIQLMRCFPCLEKLYIQSVPGGNNSWRRKHRDLIKCFDIRLKTIRLGSYGGIKSDVNFVTFFLLNAKMLELMILHVNPHGCYRGFAANELKKLKFENRASRGAQIHFKTDTCVQNISEINHVSDLDLTDPFIRRCQH